MAYGYFLWQWDNNMTEGLALMKKAIAQEPTIATFHIILAEVYFNPSGNAYSLENMDKEIRTAMRLDPGYAQPHLFLVWLHLRKKQFAAAQKELQAYLSLAPSQIEQEDWLKFYTSQIAAGMNKA